MKDLINLLILFIASLMLAMCPFAMWIHNNNIKYSDSPNAGEPISFNLPFAWTLAILSISGVFYLFCQALNKK
jgi:hypothetical protein